jgi:hypothetical protein
MDRISGMAVIEQGAQFDHSVKITESEAPVIKPIAIRSNQIQAIRQASAAGVKHPTYLP